ncbi:hypothetical protein V8F20_008946 [Naviculisporaceae sp. PSN 640]
MDCYFRLVRLDRGNNYEPLLAKVKQLVGSLTRSGGSRQKAGIPMMTNSSRSSRRRYLLLVIKFRFMSVGVGSATPTHLSDHMTSSARRFELQLLITPHYHEAAPEKGPISIWAHITFSTIITSASAITTLCQMRA